jgi:hypothetical protein
MHWSCWILYPVSCYSRGWELPRQQVAGGEKSCQGRKVLFLRNVQLSTRSTSAGLVTSPCGTLMVKSHQQNVLYPVALVTGKMRG